MASTELTLTGALQQIAGDTTGMTATAAAQYIAAAVAAVGTSPFIIQGDYDASANSPDLDTSPSASIQAGSVYTVTVAGTFFTEAVNVGDSLIAKQDAPTTRAHWVVLNGNLNYNAAGDLTIPGALTAGGTITLDAAATANLVVDGGGSGDSNILLSESGVTRWTIKRDDSDSNKFILSSASAGDILSIVEADGAATFADDLTVTGDLTVTNGVVASGAIKDEDDMSSDSATALATQQSIKAYSERDGVQVAASGYCTLGAYRGGQNLVTTQDRANFYPVVIPHAMTIQSFAWYQSVATTSATIRWAFYELDGSGGDPGTLIAEIGSVATPGIGLHTISSLSIALPAGRIALAYAGQGAAVDGQYYAADTVYGQALSSLSDPGNPASLFWYQSSVSGAFPSTASISGFGGAGYPPAVTVRRSA